MKKIKVNEIFYSLQGEGFNVGTPAVFVRLSGCNLRCAFCDTKHEEGEFLSEEEIVERIVALRGESRLVVLTGGEPSLFVTESLVEKLHEAGCVVTMETNGTHEVAAGIDFVTLSPKDQFCDGAEIVLTECDELKLVYPGSDPSKYDEIEADHRFLQPCDDPQHPENTQLTIEYILKHPKWRLSLQTHKITGIR